MQKLRHDLVIQGALCTMLFYAQTARVGAQEPPPAPPEPSSDLCPSGAADSDGDTVCDAAEASYGTDPNDADTDDDALDDSAELFGMWVSREDGEPVLLDLPALGADPLHRDVFVEIDYFLERAPQQAALDRVVAAFANGDVVNPEWGGASFNGHDFVLTLGASPSVENEAGAFMHELGHNLGLEHGGHEDVNYKPNYFSVMNYLYALSGYKYKDARILDFSRHPIFGFAETFTDEVSGMIPAPGTTEKELNEYTVFVRRPDGGIEE